MMYQSSGVLVCTGDDVSVERCSCVYWGCCISLTVFLYVLGMMYQSSGVLVCTKDDVSVELCSCVY